MKNWLHKAFTPLWFNTNELHNFQILFVKKLKPFIVISSKSIHYVVLVCHIKYTAGFSWNVKKKHEKKIKGYKYLHKAV